MRGGREGGNKDREHSKIKKKNQIIVSWAQGHSLWDPPPLRGNELSKRLTSDECLGNYQISLYLIYRDRINRVPLSAGFQLVSANGNTEGKMSEREKWDPSLWGQPGPAVFLDENLSSSQDNWVLNSLYLQIPITALPLVPLGLGL